MALKENEFANHLDDDSQPAENTNPVREGQPMGGQKFGESNNTYAGDDKNNPSQNAGYTNEYFRRTEPSDEHPEDSNFKVKDQEGLPDYDKAQARMTPPSEDQPTKNNSIPQSSIQKGIDNSDGNEIDYDNIL